MTRLARAASWPRSWPLLIGLCLITWLLGLSLALPLGTDRITQHWEDQIATYVVIALPQQGDKADELQHKLSATFPNTDVTRLSDQEVSQNLANWSTPWPGPLPTLISLHYRGDLAALTAFTHRYAADALVIPPPHQVEKLLPLLASIRHAAQRIALTTGGAVALIAPALLYLMARITALANAQQRALLPLLGGNPTSLHHILARRIALWAGLGSVLGLLLLLPSFIAMRVALRPLLHLPPLEEPHSLPQLASSLPPALWGGLCLLPALMALLGWGIVLLSCRMQDRTAP